jgi:hypothetical protein
MAERPWATAPERSIAALSTTLILMSCPALLAASSQGPASKAAPHAPMPPPIPSFGYDCSTIRTVLAYGCPLIKPELYCCRRSARSALGHTEKGLRPAHCHRECVMTLSIRLPTSLVERLAAYCRTHKVSENQAVEQAIRQLLGDTTEPAPYDLGAEGFGADQTRSGDIARNSKKLLRERFREPSAR